MIDAAEQLFFHHDFDSVSMDQVASEAQFTKRTLYQYFTSKEDLYCAVALKGFRLICRAGTVINKAGNSPRLTEWRAFDDELFQSAGRVIELGMRDGSVRDDIEPMQATYSVILMITGFMSHLAEAGTGFARHFGLDPKTLSEYPISLLLDSLRPVPGGRL